MEYRTKTVRIKIPLIRYRRVTLNQAKKDIAEYATHKKKKIWVEDVLDDLRIDPLTAVQAIRQLKKEGKIREVD